MKRINFILPALLPVFLLPAVPVQAQSALWVCQNGGSTKIVSAKEKTAGCKPYEKGMLGQGSAMFAPKDAGKAPDAPKLPSGFTDVQSGQRVELNKEAIGENLDKTLNPKAKAAGKSAPASNDLYFYFCPNSSGGQIIEAAKAPAADCQSMGKKAAVQDPRTAGKPAAAAAAPSPASPFRKDRSAEIALSDSPPGDIYKCFDKLGRPTFVAEGETKNYRRCSFFSRSFAGAKAQFQKDLQNPKSLTDLAAAGVGAAPKENIPTSEAAVRCVGAGKVQFNGSERNYNCATRSFDISAGTSGGQVALGDKSATIAAHTLDYFNTGGSCGGTVTSAEGRILHLAPTKDCPQAFQIEAKKIEQAYIKTISVNVSGAFLERQRQLSAQINQIARQVGLDPFLAHAIISAESAYKVRARSHVGAMGLMQLMPATARRFGVSDAYHTGENIRGGTTYLKWLLNKFNGNYELAIAGYNAGEGNVMKYGYKIPPFIETRAYVPKVMEYYRRYKANPALVGLQ